MEPEAGLDKLTASELTSRCYRHLLQQRPVTVNGKLPTKDDVVAVIKADFQTADEVWQYKAPKQVVSR